MSNSWHHTPGITVDLDAAQGFWVFAYGSLMWKPGFEAAEHSLARLPGFRRAFCMASIVYRGTPEDPGLVLALDRHDDAHCTGVAYRVPAESGPGVLEYLRDRELVSSAYREEIAPVELTDGRSLPALCYVMDPEHDQYRGALSLAEQAQIIAYAGGPAGSNREYLMNTVQSLARLGLEDAELFDLAERVRRML